MIAAVPPEARVAVAQTASLLAATHLPLILHADAPDAPADDDTDLPGTENTQPPGTDDVTSANDSAARVTAVPPVPADGNTPVPAARASAVPPVASGATTNIAAPPAVGVRAPATAVPPVPPPPPSLPTPSSALPASSASILHSTYMNLLSALLLVGLLGAHASSPASHASSPASHARSPAATVVIERDPPHVMPSALKNPHQPVAPRPAACTIATMPRLAPRDGFQASTKCDQIAQAPATHARPRRDSLATSVGPWRDNPDAFIVEPTDRDGGQSG
jgi:hypothetical protein